MLMPQWLYNQLQRAFRKKDRYQIKLLNDCWYFYRGHYLGLPREQSHVRKRIKS